MVDQWADEHGWGTASKQGGSSGGRPRYDWMGIDREKREPVRQDPDGGSAPRAPLTLGMTVAELVEYQRAFTTYARARLRGVGADQYDMGQTQKFEYMDPEELVAGLREELADIVNYAVMIDIQMQRMLPHYWKVRDRG